MKKYIIIIALLAITSNGFTQDVNKMITQKDVTQTITALSADDMEGRGTFQPGIEKAAGFIENQFKNAGLEPLPGNSNFRQNFKMVRTTPSRISVKLNHDSIAAENQIIVSGESFNWTDASAVKVIHMLPGKVFLEEYLAIIKQNNNVLVLVDKQYETFFKHFQKSVEHGSVTFKTNNSSAQVFILSYSTKVNSLQVDYQAKSEEMPLCNIVGFIPGKSMPNEYVIFSGHYDHLGFLKPLEGDSIANGADDDASGTTGVIILAKYYKKLNNNKRSLIFVAFTAEELGEFGSQYFATQVKPNQVTAMLNMELIGKSSKFGANTFFITGYDRSDLGSIIQKNLQQTAFKLYPDPYLKYNLFYRSDNFSLAKLGIPAHTISTDQIDTDKYYHTVKDEVSTLDLNTLTATIRAIALGTRTIVSGKDTPSRIAISPNN